MRTPTDRAWAIFFCRTILPTWSLWLTGTIVPVVELLAGGLVLVGFKTRPALLSLGGVLVLVTFGHLLKEPLYEFHTHVIPRLALLVAVLLIPREDDTISVDGYLRARRPKA